MLVSNLMSEELFTVGEYDSVESASSLMKEHKVWMLPVLRDGRLVGVVSDSDLKRAEALGAHDPASGMKIGEIMTRNPITVPADYTAGEAAQILLDHNVSGLPVTNAEGELVGTITRDDLYKLLINLTGTNKRGVQIAILIPDKPGSIKLLTDVIRKYEARVASILTTYEGAPEDERIVYLRIFDVDRSTLSNLIDELNQKGRFIYLVDLRENRRYVFMNMKA